MFKKICLIVFSVSCFTTSVLLAQPERFVDRASERPFMEAPKDPAAEQKAKKGKLSRLQEEKSDADAKKHPVRQRIGSRAPNGLR